MVLAFGGLAATSACAVKEASNRDSLGADSMASAGAPAVIAPAAGTAEDSLAPAVPAGAAPGSPVAATTPGAPRPGSSPAQASTGAQEPADTLRGTVAVVGSFPMTSVVVRPATGRSVTVTGSLAPEIARAAGAEVWVAGARSGQQLAVTRYAVRSVDGAPTVDGTLARDGDRLVLVTPGGRRPIARPLQALWGMIGARVWLVGPLDGTISSYGVLRDP